MITQTRLKEIFDYVNGELIWKINPGKNQYIGRVAGVVGQGYKHICVDRKKYLAHRLIFLYHHGCIPEIVDHINRNTLDNRIENLREASKSQNARNSKVYKNNVSGITGVRWDNQKQKWQSSIRVNSIQTHLGFFEEINDAIESRKKAEEKYFGEFNPL